MKRDIPFITVPILKSILCTTQKSVLPPRDVLPTEENILNTTHEGENISTKKIICYACSSYSTHKGEHSCTTHKRRTESL